MILTISVCFALEAFLEWVADGVYRRRRGKG